jgi:hypothetical protein
MASRTSHSSFVPSHRNTESTYLSILYISRPNLLQGLVRMKNLPFAYFLNCDSLNPCAPHKN